MIKVIKSGLETSVQDYPGRIGYWNQGFPISGPFDDWSFRLANLLVGNSINDATLEAQFLGPTLEFEEDMSIAVTGADMQGKLNGNPLNMFESINVKKGDVLSFAFAIKGVRTYIAFGGGIKTEPWLNSKSTFHKAGVGGINGSALKDGIKMELNSIRISNLKNSVKETSKPTIPSGKKWEIEVVAGPNDDWIDKEGQNRFLSNDYKLNAKSDRTGYRLDGPEWSFTDKATNKLSEHGSDPANIIDHGYPRGAINLAGQTPIILVSDGPTMGGFINPYTVPSCAFYKLAQAKPGTIFNFKEISVDEAQKKALDISNLCSEANIIKE